MGSNDQAIMLTGQDTKLLLTIDAAVDNAVEQGDLEMMGNLLLSYRKNFQLAGVGLAKILFRWKENLPVFGIEAEDFEDVVFEKAGISIQTTRKYTDVWQYIFENELVDENIRLQLMGRPMNQLMRIAPASKEGVLYEDHWEQLSVAEDDAAVKAIIAEARGDEPRTSSETAVSIRLKRDGTLECKLGTGGYQAFGFLNLKLEAENTTVKVAIARLERVAGFNRE